MRKSKYYSFWILMMGIGFLQTNAVQANPGQSVPEFKNTPHYKQFQKETGYKKMNPEEQKQADERYRNFLRAKNTSPDHPAYENPNDPWARAAAQAEKKAKEDRQNASEYEKFKRNVNYDRLSPEAREHQDKRFQNYVNSKKTAPQL